MRSDEEKELKERYEKVKIAYEVAVRDREKALKGIKERFGVDNLSDAQELLEKKSTDFKILKRKQARANKRILSILDKADKNEDR
jgi:hypothetical protein